MSRPGLMRTLFWKPRTAIELTTMEREHKLWALTNQLLELTEEEWEAVKRAREGGYRLGVKYPGEVE